MERPDSRQERDDEAPAAAGYLVATGNNLQLGGDLGRRSYRIRLDAGVARPWQRDGFRHPHLLRHVLRHRGELLAAILTAARGWFAAGCPPADVPRLGGFEEWTRTVGGILAFAEVPGFLENLHELYDQVDEDETAWSAFLAAWHRALRGGRGHGRHRCRRREGRRIRTARRRPRRPARRVRGESRGVLQQAVGPCSRASGGCGVRLLPPRATWHAAPSDSLEGHAGEFREFGSFFRSFETSQSDKSNPPTTPKNSPDSPNSPIADGADSELPF